MNIADLCYKLIDGGVDILFNPTPQGITRIVLTLFIGLVMKQQEDIDEKLNRMLASHYKAGRVHLQNATDILENARDILDEERKKRSIDEAEKSIDEAKGKFVEALALESEGSLRSANAEFFIGVCYDLRNNKELALTWYENAHKTGQALESKLQKKAEFSIIDFVLVYRFYTRSRARRELAELQKEFLGPLSNRLAAPFSQATVRAAPRPPTWGYLIFDTGKQSWLSGSRVLVGRGDLGSEKPEVDLALLPASTTVSRAHAALMYDGNTCTVTDLGSTNFTYIDEKRLTANQPSPIIDGDRLGFGNVRCTFKRA